jgi:hypothetical protein
MNHKTAPQTRTQPAPGKKHGRVGGDDDDDNDGNIGDGPRKLHFTNSGRQHVGPPQKTRNGKVGPPRQPSISLPNGPTMIEGRPSDEVKPRIWQHKGDDGDPVDLDNIG